MDKYEKDKLIRYGKLVWDFANAKTTDNILTSFFANVQSVFNFSGDFAEKALKHSPTMQMTIGALSSEEKKLFEILLKRNELFKSCNTTFTNSYLCINKYEPIDLMFTISERNWIGDFPYFTDNPKEKTISIPEKEIEDYIDNSAIEYDEKNGLKAKLKTLVNIYNQIEEIKSKTASRFETIEELAEDYPDITYLHDNLKDIQITLQDFIFEIIEAGYEASAFKNILRAYNEITKTKYFINDDHKLIEIGPFTEDNFFAQQSYLNKKEIFTNRQIIEKTICYCLIEYLKNPEYQGRERLTACKKCNAIFSKSRLNDKQIYCPVCSQKNKMSKEERAVYQRDYNKIRKERKAKEKKRILEKEISNLIAQGIKPKEARELAELKLKDK